MTFDVVVDHILFSLICAEEPVMKLTAAAFFLFLGLSPYNNTLTSNKISKHIKGMIITTH